MWTAGGAALLGLILLGSGISQAQQTTTTPSTTPPALGDIRKDTQDIRQDRKEIRQDRKDIREDQRERRQDLKDRPVREAGPGGELRRDARELRDDRREIREDRKEIMNDRRKLEAEARVGRPSPLRKRGSGRCPAPPCPLLVALVEHLERVAIARHLPVLPGILQPLLQLVHLLLPLAVGRALVEQVEQRHVDDLAAPDDHVLVDPAGKGFAGVLLHNLGLERVIADLRLRDRANDLDLLPQLRNV